MTLQDLKYKPEIYERVKEAKLIFNKYEIDYSDNLHVVSLFNAVE